jgi:hypothetical protein
MTFMHFPPRTVEELLAFMSAFLVRYNELRRQHGQTQVGADLFAVKDFGVWSAVLWESTPGAVSVQGVGTDFDSLDHNLQKRIRDLKAKRLFVKDFTIDERSLNQNPLPQTLGENKWQEDQPE